MSKSDVICFAETRLHPNDKDLDYAIEGFKPIIRNDQETCGQRPPHGLAVYLKDCFKVDSLNFFSESKVESITLEIVDGRNDECYTILIVYKSPSCSLNDFQTCRNAVKVISSHKLIIMGDFNFDISSNRNRGFVDSMKTFFPHAKLQNTLPTTHGNTKLDLCLTTCENASARIIACVWSYHHTLIGSFL